MDKNRQLVNAYYAELLNAFLPQLIDEDLNFLPINEELNTKIRTFKEKAEKENIQVTISATENEIFINILHRESHRSCRMIINKHRILTGEISRFYHFNSPDVLNLLNDSVKTIIDPLEKNFHQWTTVMVYKHDEILSAVQKPRKLENLDVHISYMVWKVFQSYPIDDHLKGTLLTQTLSKTGSIIKRITKLKTNSDLQNRIMVIGRCQSQDIQIIMF